MSTLYSPTELATAVEPALCFSDVCRLLNITICSFNYKRIKKLCLINNISTDHFDAKKTFRRNKFEWKEEDVFCVDSRIGRSQLRPLCIKMGLYTGVCNKCGCVDTWNSEPLVIELDHINGINDDNRRENLQWLCPNCHSQTPTYRNRLNRTTRNHQTIAVSSVG